MCVERGLATSISHRTLGFIVFAQDWHSHDDNEFEIWGQHCVRETQGAEEIDEFLPLVKEAHVIRKQKYSAFFGTDLDAHLKEKGIRLLIIVGVATNICVMHTAIDATHRGYELIVPFDERLDAWERENHPQNKGSSNVSDLSIYQ